jgi:Tol biopolymer transport system component
VPAILQRAVSVWACSTWLWLATAGDPLVTVAQRDRFRSARASRTCDVSADGRFVAFESWVGLVPADEDQRADIYVLDRTNGHVTLESMDLDAYTDNSHPRISGDGRYVVFEARTLQNEPRVDVILRDRSRSDTRSLTGHIAKGSAHAWSRGPDISDDGRVVAFSSAATTLTDGVDANGPREDVYVIDVASGALRRASVTSSGIQPAAGNSIVPTLSADGRWVAFASTAPLDVNSQGRQDIESTVRQVFLRDMAGGTTTLVSRPRRGAPPNNDSSLPSVSGDGRYIAFASNASNLDLGKGQDQNRGSDVFLFDRDTNAITKVSRGADGSEPNGASANPAMSADGRFIAFQSDASNLVCSGRCARADEDINLIWDVVVFDRTTGKAVRVSEDELGAWMEWSVGPSIDGSGRVVAFSSRHPMDAADRLDDADLFVRLLTPPALTRRVP